MSTLFFNCAKTKRLSVKKIMRLRFSGQDWNCPMSVDKPHYKVSINNVLFKSKVVFSKTHFNGNINCLIIVDICLCKDYRIKFMSIIWWVDIDFLPYIFDSDGRITNLRQTVWNVVPTWLVQSYKKGHRH